MRKHSVDLNSDMGEGFGPWTIGDGVDEQIMPLISSANIATGFHAGDPNIMARTVQLARDAGVGIGAHPGFRDLVGFGRRTIAESPQALVNDIVYQLGALREFARLNGVSLQHVKPHGALYMHAAASETFSRLLIETLQRVDPGLLLYCMEASATYRVAAEYGQPVVREFYADRDYDRSGSIVFTRRVGRLDARQVADKVLRACVDGKVRTVDGDDIDIDFDSVCIHSDTPGALALVRETRDALTREGIRTAGPRPLAAQH
ncbi:MULTISPECIES: 5-oxoprolinase subunit PxpA [Burkholderia cepacia complex]|uniref:LamB/YcsF family protein n=1 Tax=Burkholderia multivorans TaxID=87883 RepID=A0A1W1AJ49_9BURK|nr:MULTISPECIES: 5-oxoprolinase subunit PxpA [Burkholderia cepacia complex]KVP26228.1 lactam utilization protein LamB [Burkholderia multivorans]KVZ29263.1 lactam utilization protein LamB [Burkholderia multivorans]KWF69177.1 lactam utilization protein LamB [Burkholderia multivorans]KWF76426.1 lactam utilization protein LamB [Burkholderia multivorans]KWI52363.1 lactam utilization protein LamB [Burkholderia pseudomultivorans]